MGKSLNTQIDVLREVLTTLARWEETLPVQDQSFISKTRLAFWAVAEELQVTREKL